MFIDFSPEKKSHIKTEIMKSLKTRNKSPVHYKYTWQRCANQSCLFAEGYGRRGLPSTSRPASPRQAAQRDAQTRTHTHTSRQMSRPQHTLTAGRGRRVVSVECTYWSVSSRELARDLANGPLRADPQMGPTYQNRVGKTELRGHRRLLLRILFFFFNATFQSFLLI